MGAGQSTSSDDQNPSRALHVLRVTPSSPASQTNIEPFFDFIVGFEGDSISEHKQIEVTELERIVEKHEDRTVNLLVWSSKSKMTRVVPIVPSRAWSLPKLQASQHDHDDGAAEPKPSLLGLSMRMCDPEFALDNVWHVLDVLEGSPAESAGLVPYGDWIVGWSGGVLSAEGDFYDLVEAHVEKPLRVYVYSYDFDTLREVVLVPNRHWGGEGLLGCVFGFGLLHRIPPPPTDRQPGSIPPELADQDDLEQQELFVPADVAEQTPRHSVDRVHQWRHDSHTLQHDNNYNHRPLQRSPMSPDRSVGSPPRNREGTATPTLTRMRSPLTNGHTLHQHNFSSSGGNVLKSDDEESDSTSQESEDDEEEGSIAATEMTGISERTSGSLTSVD